MGFPGRSALDRPTYVRTYGRHTGYEGRRNNNVELQVQAGKSAGERTRARSRVLPEQRSSHAKLKHDNKRISRFCSSCGIDMRTGLEVSGQICLSSGGERN